MSTGSGPWPDPDLQTVIGGGGLTATVLPSRGAKIGSLRDASREWLAQPAIPVGPPARGAASFVDAELAGWDECAPSITGCAVDGTVVHDHGDLWALGFDRTTDGVRVAHPRFSFERRIVPTATGLRLDYRAQAIERPLPFLWAAHPQFVAPPGSRIELPDRLELVDVLDAPTLRQPWSAELASIDTVPVDGRRKVFVEPDHRVDRATLVHPDGARLTLRWCSEQLPYLGLWFDHGAFSREPVIAIEPMTGYHDSLERAVALGRVLLLEPDQPFEWWVEVSALSAPAAR